MLIIDNLKTALYSRLQLLKLMGGFLLYTQKDLVLFVTEQQIL